MKKKINLFTTYYNEKDVHRKSELIFCLSKNFYFFDNIFILDESKELLPNTKNYIIQIEDRPTFRFIFEKINEFADENDINVIANTDIFFDDSFFKVCKIIHSNNNVVALTRWEYDKLTESAKFHHSFWSQDAWIFKGKPRINFEFDYYLGQLGCDNRLAYDIIASGYKIINPALSLKCYHVHASSERSYFTNGANKVPEPYYFFLPKYYPRCKAFIKIIFEDFDFFYGFFEIRFKFYKYLLNNGYQKRKFLTKLMFLFYYYIIKLIEKYKILRKTC